jgi:hypothetical protein
MATEPRIAGLHKQRLQPLDPGLRTNDFASRITTASNRTFVRLLNQIFVLVFRFSRLGPSKTKDLFDGWNEYLGLSAVQKEFEAVLAQTSYLHLLSLLMQDLDFQA